MPIPTGNWTSALNRAIMDMPDWSRRTDALPGASRLFCRGTQTVNRSRIQAYLQENGLDGWLLYDFRGTNPIALHVAGLRHSGTRRWFLWIPAQGGPTWLVHAIETTTFAQVADPILTYVGWRQLRERLAQLVVGTEGRRPRIAMEYSPQAAIPYVSTVDAGTKELVEAATGAEIVSSADLVQEMQAVLTLGQLQSHRRAAEACLAAKDAAFALVAQRLQAGDSITDYDVQQFILERFAAANMDSDHPPIVAVNGDAANPHFAPSADRRRPIRPGDMLLIDLWAREQGDPQACFADITWTAYCGPEVPPKVRHVFQVVAAARDRAVAYIQAELDAGRPVYGYAVDDACRQVIADAGFGPHFIHRTGHSLGTQVHFVGVNIDNLETQDQRRLIPGVMFTIEPGIYLPDYDFDDSGEARGLGIRSEINCFMHGDRVEVTTLPAQSAVLSLL